MTLTQWLGCLTPGHAFLFALPFLIVAITFIGDLYFGQALQKHATDSASKQH
jgi:hypothetical protein